MQAIFYTTILPVTALNLNFKNNVQIYLICIYDKKGVYTPVLSMFWPGKVMLAKLDSNIGLKNNNNKIIIIKVARYFQYRITQIGPGHYQIPKPYTPGKNQSKHRPCNA